MTVRIIDYGSGNLHSALKAFAVAGEALGLKAELAREPESLRTASHIVLPGVGAFGDCVAGLMALDGMVEALEDAALARGIPFFGICVGMQMLLERGFEHGEHTGLGWIRGEVVPLSSRQSSVVSRQSTHTTDNWQPATASDISRRPEGRPGGRPSLEPASFQGAVAPSAERRATYGREQEASAGSKLKIPHMGWNTLSPTRAHPFFDGLLPQAHVYFVHSFQARCADPASLLATTDYGGEVCACIGRDNLLGTQFHPEKSGPVGLRLIENFLRM